MFIMKHATSRFLRFFLVAALVAAMVGSLLPAKVAGQAALSVEVTPSKLAVGEAIEWTITLSNATLLTDVNTAATGGTDDDASEITLTFAGVDVNVPPSLTDSDPTPDTTDPAVTNPGSLITVNGTPLAAGATFTAGVGGTIVFPTPVAASGTVTIKIASHYVDDPDTNGTGMDESATATTEHAATVTDTATVTVAVDDVEPAAPVTPATATSDAYETYIRPVVVTPNPTRGLQAGQASEWEITTTNTPSATEGLTADADRITVKFSSGTVPSGITKDEILVRAGGDSSRLEIAPTVSGRTISFLSPVDIEAADVTATAPVRIVISASVGIAAPNAAGGMAVSVKLGTNVEATSLPVSVGRYLNISPRSAARNATVTVTGGGFTPGTSGGITVGTTPTGGSYTVDSTGKLTGSFVASSSTAAGGLVKVVDLGVKDVEVEGPMFTQLASASPASTEVARGASVRITLTDFPSTGDWAVTIAGRTVPVGTTATPVVAATQREEGSFTPAANGLSGTLVLPQSEDTGTKRVMITRGTGSDAKSARFLIAIIGRTLVVSPSTAVPGQPVTVSGAGFTASSEGGIRVNLMLGDMAITDGQNLRVNTDGSFLYTGKVPFADGDDPATADVTGTLDTSKAGTKRWTATEVGGNGRAATSSGFTIQKRAITLSPSTANPGASVEVFGSGFGVKTRLDVTSQVTVTLSTNPNTKHGPFPVSATGEFTGTITVPSDAQVTQITVTAEDNNGANPGTDGFTANQKATAMLRVPTGTISVSPTSASTGSTITVSGQGFPTQTNLSALTFGTANALPVPAPATDVNGNFTVTLTVPAASEGGSLAPGAVVITAKVGNISGTSSFTIPGPSITLSSDSARPGDTLVITGMGFSAFANVSSVTIGRANQTPVPNPLTDGTGNFNANVVVPTLNPGAYTVTVRTGATFTATHSIRILSATVGNARAPEDALRSLISREILTLAAAASPGGTSFGAFVPGLAGNTLALIEPNGVLILTLNADARISVSGQAAVDVAADTPTFFAIGSTVSIEVVE